MRLQVSNKARVKRVLLILLFFSVVFFSHRVIHAGQTLGVNPTLALGEIVPLTPGSSTDVTLKTDGAFRFDLQHFLNVNLTTVICLGAGTLHIDLTKDDTENELVVMLVTGFPTDPLFIPAMDITPAKIGVSMDIEDMLSGFGIVFIFSGINASESRTYEISLELEKTD